MSSPERPDSEARPRLDLLQVARAPYEAFLAANRAIVQGPLDVRVRELVKLRASQLNACAFCVDMHATEARELGESTERLDQLVVWHESRLFTGAERAALEYTEAVTRPTPGGVSDALWDEVRAHFAPEALGALVAQVALINAFNRIATPLRTPPGFLRRRAA